MEISEWIKMMLVKKGWTQADLARESGLDTAVISNLVNGRRGPGMDTYRALAKGFGIPLKELFIQLGILPPDNEYDDIIRDILIDLGGFPVSEKEDIQEIIKAKRRVSERRGEYGRQQ